MTSNLIIIKQNLNTLLSRVQQVSHASNKVSGHLQLSQVEGLPKARLRSHQRRKL